MEKLRIFIVGAGHIARSHAQIAQKLTRILAAESGQEVELELFAADPVDAALAGFALEFPDAKVFASVEEMLALPAQENDVAVIATPPFLHRDGAITALRSGRHTLVEKPVATTEAEALEIAAAAQSAGKQWGDCSMRLYNMSSTRELRQRILSGEIGTPYHVSHIHKGGWSRPGIEYQPISKWFLDKSKAGGGILVDWGVYDLANLTFLLQPYKVEIRNAWKERPATPIDPTDVVFDVETHAGATMVWVLEDGTRVHVNYERSSGTHGKSQRYSEIEGTKGAYEWAWAYNSDSEAVHRYYGAEGGMEETLRFDDEWEASWEISQMERPLITFVRRLRGAQIPALMNEDALFNFQLICGLFRASETGEMLIIERNSVGGD